MFSYNIRLFIVLCNLTFHGGAHKVPRPAAAVYPQGRRQRGGASARGLGSPSPSIGREQPSEAPSPDTRSASRRRHRGTPYFSRNIRVHFTCLHVSGRQIFSSIALSSCSGDHTSERDAKKAGKLLQIYTIIYCQETDARLLCQIDLSRQTIGELM